MNADCFVNSIFLRGGRTSEKPTRFTSAPTTFLVNVVARSVLCDEATLPRMADCFPALRSGQAATLAMTLHILRDL